MKQLIQPGLLRGTVTVPSSKSQAHRAVIAACLSGGISQIRNLYFSQDIRATVSAMSALGAKVTETGDTLSVSGAYPDLEDGALIDCCESGSTLRFLIPLALLSGKTVTFTGRGRLMSRPLDPYFALFENIGIKAGKAEDRVTFSGKLTGGDFELPGNVSSQFV
ncbi:MAG: 3-phosphoshikimate 1-carboxyvinyltransferase, partial [Clostridia bacterium]|nr:3-phosphoshikimate 1-carboxyvinyltransferase [Clostridia bacterium]